MKLIKLFCLLLIIMLTGCMVSDFNYKLDTLDEEVISAEIVEVTTLESGELDINSSNLISDENLSSVLSDLSKIEFIVTLGRPQIPKGNCLKLNYQNDYELICENSLIKNNNDNEHISHKDIYKPKGFDEFISKYKKE